jgi:hypothetical protein
VLRVSEYSELGKICEALFIDWLNIDVKLMYPNPSNNKEAINNVRAGYQLLYA